MLFQGRKEMVRCTHVCINFDPLTPPYPHVLLSRR